MTMMKMPNTIKTITHHRNNKNDNNNNNQQSQQHGVLQRLQLWRRFNKQAPRQSRGVAQQLHARARAPLVPQIFAGRPQVPAARVGAPCSGGNHRHC